MADLEHDIETIQLRMHQADVAKQNALAAANKINKEAQRVLRYVPVVSDYTDDNKIIAFTTEA